MFLRYLHFCPDLSVIKKKDLIRKLWLISKFMKLQTGKIITMHILLNISRRKGSQAIKFGQLKFERRFFFLKFSGFFFFFFWYSYSFWTDLFSKYLVVSTFLLKVTEFKENVLICVITGTIVLDLLLTLVQVITMFAALVSRMNLHGLLILINTSYMCDILLCRVMVITSIKINC